MHLTSCVSVVLRANMKTWPVSVSGCLWLCGWINWSFQHTHAWLVGSILITGICKYEICLRVCLWKKIFLFSLFKTGIPSVSSVFCCIVEHPSTHVLTMYLFGDCRYCSFSKPSFLSVGVLFFSLLFLTSRDGRVNKTTTRLVIGPKYSELRDWHHGVSARALNVQ